MTIACILANKGRQVATIKPRQTLRDVIDVLAAKRIGALVVVGADGKLLGIIPERDAVRAIAKRGCDALDDEVSAHMTRDVVTASEGDAVIAAAQRMSAGRFRHMPIVVDGVVSIGDAVKYRLEQMEREQSALRESIAG